MNLEVRTARQDRQSRRLRDVIAAIVRARMPSAVYAAPEAFKYLHAVYLSGNGSKARAVTRVPVILFPKVAK